MKLKPEVEKYRLRHVGEFSSMPGDLFGFFIIPGPHNIDLRVIASCGDELIKWEHISVSCQNRCPNWIEMSYIKDLFWDEEEVVMQLHPAKSKWINNMQYCLHMWKPLDCKIPLPPDIAVGIKGLGKLGQ